MADRRPQLAAQIRFLENREALAPLDLRRRFEYIFESNLWGSDESRSGPGSMLVETETLRKQLPMLLREIGARSLLDIPCGDFRWLSEVDLGVPYLGLTSLRNWLYAMPNDSARHSGDSCAWISPGIRCLMLTSSSAAIAWFI